jgi:hypothetical protein
LVDGLFDYNSQALHFEDVTSSITNTKNFDILLIANPRSGSRGAAKFINRYGTDHLHEVKLGNGQIGQAETS